MMLFYQLLLIITHALLLGAIVTVFGWNGRNIYQRFLNPGCWIAVFFVLWFWIPEIVIVSYGNVVIGYPEATPTLVLHSQLYLAAFLISLLVGAVLIRCLIPLSSRNKRFPSRELSGIDYQILIAFYLVGLVSTMYLGRTLMTSEGFRSELLKSPDGKIATMLGYFGMFAMAVLGGHMLATRRLMLALLVFGCYGAAIFFTGARGRILWPTALAIAYSWCHINRIRTAQIAAFAVVGISLLLIFDPLFIVLREGTRHFSIDKVWERIEFADLYLTDRNFDGFANFTLISTRDLVPHSASIAIQGARAPFMETYFPGILERGVSFGTTVPGLFWMAGGFYGLVLGGLGYGAFLGALGLWATRIRHEPLVWSYLFAITWLAAIGGEFIEGLDKMAAMAAPGVIWWALSPRSDLTSDADSHSRGEGK